MGLRLAIYPHFLNFNDQKTSTTPQKKKRAFGSVIIARDKTSKGKEKIAIKKPMFLPC